MWRSQGNLGNVLLLVLISGVAWGERLKSHNGQAITCSGDHWYVADDQASTIFYYCSNGYEVTMQCAYGTCVAQDFYYGRMGEIHNPCSMFCDHSDPPPRPGTTTGSTGAPFSCHFVDDDCGMEVFAPPYPYDSFRWHRRTGPSPTYANKYLPAADKGPAAGHTTGTPTDGYMYIEGERGQALTSHSSLIINEDRSSDEPQRLTFNYWMNGITFDSGSSLAVRIQYEENGVMVTKDIWRVKGNKGAAWQYAQVALPAFPGGSTGTYRIHFLATLGVNPSYYPLHDFALDDIDILDGAILASDCQDLRNQGNVVSGMYHIRTDPGTSRVVYCDMDHVGTVIMRRTKSAYNTISFDVDRAKYVSGFGSGNGDLWYGLDPLAQETFINPMGNNYDLLFLLTDNNDFVYEARYSGFQVRSSAYDYQLSVTGFIGGNAGNALLDDPDTSALNMKFSTHDYDFDHDTYGHCAVRHGGGWWYNSCSDSCMTCPWTPPGEPYATTCDSGLCVGWRTLDNRTFKKAEMLMIKV